MGVRATPIIGGIVIGMIALDAHAQNASDLSFDAVPGVVEVTADKQQNFVAMLKNYLGVYYGIPGNSVHLGPTTIWNKAHHDGFIVCIDENTFQIALSIPTTQGESIAMKLISSKAERDQYGCSTPGGTLLSP